ncbi:hypothetical protein [Actinophytocola xanthii]|uniref:Uncharacterized protein n=1 Tax=Actinophytocola xanthii TaxID=1912961 RepID=A0A1Q8CWQ6_9PSEU|nr:hypothetical protein [Actinophytocola xanthii]OLF18801.1 hypothetical protein BU204_04705 [Actinophytocola xanthii]
MVLAVGMVLTGGPTAGADTPVDPPVGDVRPLACSGHGSEYGDWVNVDPFASVVVRVELRDCQAVTVCTDDDLCHIAYDVGWNVRVVGKCRPMNCDWGWSEPGYRLSSGHIYGFYDQGLAKTYVYAKLPASRPSLLSVYWRRDFVDPNRPDQTRQEWFRRV